MSSKQSLAEAREEQKEVLERLRGVQEALEKELGHSESLQSSLEQLRSRQGELEGELHLAESRKDEEEMKHREVRKQIGPRVYASGFGGGIPVV